MTIRGWGVRAACAGLVLAQFGWAAAAGAARPQGEVVDASRLTLEGLPAGPGTRLAKGQLLRVSGDGEATIAFGDAAIKLSEGAQARILDLAPKVRLQLTAGSLLAVSGGKTEVQAITPHATAICRHGAIFVNQGPGTPTYVCACAGTISVASHGGPPTEIPHPHHRALLVDGYAFKPAISDRHGGQDIWSLVMDLGPAAGEPLRHALWNAIMRPPVAARPRAPLALPQVPDLLRPARGAAPPAAAAPGAAPAIGSTPARGSAPAIGSARAPGSAPALAPAAAGGTLPAGAPAPVSGIAPAPAPGSAPALPARAPAAVRAPGSAPAVRPAAAAPARALPTPRPAPARRGAAGPTPKKSEPPDLEQLFPDAVSTESETP